MNNDDIPPSNTNQTDIVSKPFNDLKTLPLPSNSLISSEIKDIKAVPRSSWHLFPLQISSLLESYRRNFPDLSTTLKENGISRPTWESMLSRDQAFVDAIQEIKDEMADKIEAINYKLASWSTPKTFLDRMAFLRKARPGTWNPTTNIQVKVQESPEQVQGRLVRLANAIDGEVIKSPQLVERLNDVLQSVHEPETQPTPNPNPPPTKQSTE